MHREIALSFVVSLIVLATAWPNPGRCGCPMASKDGRHVLVQSSTESMDGASWSTRRVVHDLKGWRRGAPKIAYSSDSFTSEEPDLDHLSRGLKKNLEPYGIVGACIAPKRVTSGAIKIKLSGDGNDGTKCRAMVKTKDGPEVHQEVSFTEEAMHGADMCAAGHRTTYYEIPGGKVLLVEITAVLEDDPAMGAMDLGMTYLFVPTGK